MIYKIKFSDYYFRGDSRGYFETDNEADVIKKGNEIIEKELSYKGFKFFEEKVSKNLMGENTIILSYYDINISIEKLNIEKL